MKSFPMFIKMSGRQVVIVGGGEQAAQKARLMLKTEATLTIAAPNLDDELAALVDTGRATQHAGALTPALFHDTALVLIGSGCPAIDRCAHDLAKAAGALLNVVDQPALCDVTTPSIVDRDPVVVAIGTEGTAPVLGRAIKTDIEKLLDPRLGAFAALAGRLRDAVARRVPRENRREFWRWAFQDAPWQAFRRGSEREAAALLKSALDGGVQQTGGVISRIDASADTADLMTLRAVARLQEADVIYYDHAVNPDILELARRDAERVLLGPSGDFPHDPLLLRAAQAGQRVVHLCLGNLHSRPPLTGPDVTVELIPGVSPTADAPQMTRSA